MTKPPSHTKSMIRAMPRLTAVLLLVTSVIGGLISAAPQAHAQAKAGIKKSFGDWQIECGKPPGARSQRCLLLQSVEDEDRSNVGLKVIFLVTSKGDRVLRVIAPLGILLPFGLGLQIDKEPIGDKPLPFIRCLPLGCISEIIVKDALLDKFKTGTTALFIIVETKEEGRAIPVSLKGFTKGFEYLTALSKSK